MDDWDFWVPGIEGVFGHFGSQSFDLRGWKLDLGLKGLLLGIWDVGFSSFWTPAGPKVKIRCPELGVTERANLGVKLDLILCAME